MRRSRHGVNEGRAFRATGTAPDRDLGRSAIMPSGHVLITNARHGTSPGGKEGRRQAHKNIIAQSQPTGLQRPCNGRNGRVTVVTVGVTVVTVELTSGKSKVSRAATSPKAGGSARKQDAVASP